MRPFPIQIGLALLFLSSAAPAAVITEIHYHPPDSGPNLEFVEVSNDTTTPEDISGWRFVEGIEFEFPAGTILQGVGAIVVCADAAAVRERYGLASGLGDFSGKLDNSGERRVPTGSSTSPMPSRSCATSSAACPSPAWTPRTPTTAARSI